MEEDVRRPGVSVVAGNSVQGPLRRSVEDPPGGFPRLQVLRCENADAETGAEQIPDVSAADGDGVVGGGLEGIKGRSMPKILC